jgi:hypothetical protein
MPGYYPTEIQPGWVATSYIRYKNKGTTVTEVCHRGSHINVKLSNGNTTEYWQLDDPSVHCLAPPPPPAPEPEPEPGYLKYKDIRVGDYHRGGDVADEVCFRSDGVRVYYTGRYGRDFYRGLSDDYSGFKRGPKPEPPKPTTRTVRVRDIRLGDKIRGKTIKTIVHMYDGTLPVTRMYTYDFARDKSDLHNLVVFAFTLDETREIDI